jgi:hypothetical protein
LHGGGGGIQVAPEHFAKLGRTGVDAFVTDVRHFLGGLFAFGVQHLAKVERPSFSSSSSAASASSSSLSSSNWNSNGGDQDDLDDDDGDDGDKAERQLVLVLEFTALLRSLVSALAPFRTEGYFNSPDDPARLRVVARNMAQRSHRLSTTAPLTVEEMRASDMDSYVVVVVVVAVVVVVVVVVRHRRCGRRCMYVCGLSNVELIESS